jgi:dolichol-phosphate mannosyltransferase
MQSVFGSKPNFRLVRHEQNAGVSAAILTGIRHSETELVCSMDCDCSYDPLEFSRMLPLMTDDVDLVTASPYHPKGRVKNVAGWRLLLSKGLSTIYRIVLPQKLHTWTSCFRVYRKSAIEKLSLHEAGFLGTAELVGQLCLNGSKIVEHPATLEVRIFGESKMKTFHTIAGHLRLVQQLVKQRLGRTPNIQHRTLKALRQTLPRRCSILQKPLRKVTSPILRREAPKACPTLRSNSLPIRTRPAELLVRKNLKTSRLRFAAER